MEAIKEFLHLIGSVEGITELIRWGGLAILILIVFAETGLLVGFFLPGDSLLFTAGFVAGTTDALSIVHILIALPIAAIVGDSVGYLIGRKAGLALYNRPQSRWFQREHLLKTRRFYEQYGGMTLVMARFLPFARTFAPTVAGVAEMPYIPNFLGYSVLGGLGWVSSMSLLGYFFGQIPGVAEHVEKVILGIIFLSVVPVIVHARRRRAHAA
ncbi:MAG: VTT domain-containing protein [Armatimonadetes bacterium]|nr:VTT domain-containing protein [Armatimonadota bacterium]